MFTSPHNSYIEILNPIMMVLGGGAFARCLGHEGGAVMDGVSAHINETPESSHAASRPHEDTARGSHL